MIAIGVDLAGPRSASRTALVAARDGAVFEARAGWSDADILDFLLELSADNRVVLGLDAPLSYGESSGDRPSDTELRSRLVAAGLHPGTVMAPLAPRMVYLTVRGIALSRAIEAHDALTCEIVEVHPAATMALRGASAEDVRSLKRDGRARARLIDWLHRQGLSKLPPEAEESDHLIAAAAGALAAWRWASGDSEWCARAKPPNTPYDFSC